MKFLSNLVMGFITFALGMVAYAQGYGPQGAGAQSQYGAMGYYATPDSGMAKRTVPGALPGTYAGPIKDPTRLVSIREPNGMRIKNPDDRVRVPQVSDSRAYAMSPVPDMNGLRGMGDQIRAQMASTRSAMTNEAVAANTAYAPIDVSPTITIMNAPQMANENTQSITNTFNNNQNTTIDVDAGAGGQVAQQAQGGSSKNKSGGVLGKIARGVDTVGGIVKDVFKIGKIFGF